MTWVALNCPQCSAPLPRVALWRSVKCGSCGALITRTESVVMRESFRKALERAQRSHGGAGQDIECGGRSYQLIQNLGRGELSEVYLAKRTGTMPLLATIKISSTPSAKVNFAREVQVLRELHDMQTAAVGFSLSAFLPAVLAVGAVGGGPGRNALIFHHPTGYWGSLAALNHQFPGGIDPRHAVWIWRRMLGILSLLHSQGWAHNDVRPEHALVHPRDHGVRLVSWGAAEKAAGSKKQAADLLRSARVVLVLLNGASATEGVRGSVPAAFAGLVNQASQDVEFCRLQGADGLDILLRAAARAAFGPPSFVPLSI
jgi:serine/threonine protein kinase